MKLKLTKTTINSIAKYHNSNKPVFIWDSTTTGFGIKINISGKAVYVAERKTNKKTQRSTIGNVSVFTLEDARTKAKEFISDTTTKQMLLSELIEEYIAVKTLSERSIINYKSTTKYFQDVVISTITIQQVNRWYAGGQNRQTTIERAYRQLKALFNYAVATQLLPVSPFNSIINRWKIKPKSNHLEPANHLPRFWKALVEKDNITSKLIMMYLLTGLRKGAKAQIN